MYKNKSNNIIFFNQIMEQAHYLELITKEPKEGNKCRNSNRI